MSMGVTAFYSDSRRLEVPEILSMMELNYAPKQGSTRKKEKPNYNQEHYEPPEPEPEPEPSRGHLIHINVSQIHPKIERYPSLHFSIISTISTVLILLPSLLLLLLLLILVFLYFYCT